MSFGQTGAELLRYGACLAFWIGRAAETISERFAFEKLHADEIDLTVKGRSSMDLEDLAYIRMAIWLAFRTSGGSCLPKPALAHFSATRRFSLSSTASQTMPMPPWATSRTIRKRLISCCPGSNGHTSFGLGCSGSSMNPFMRFSQTNVVPCLFKPFRIRATRIPEICFALVLRTSSAPPPPNSSCQVVSLRYVCHRPGPSVQIAIASFVPHSLHGAQA